MNDIVASCCLNRILYWSEDGRISSTTLDGGSSAVVLVSTDVMYPSGLTINYLTSQIFWADPSMGTIEYSGLDGSDRTTLLSEPSLNPFNIDVLGNYVVWNSLGATNFHLIDIVEGGEDVVVTPPTGNSLPVYGFVVVSDRRKPSTGLCTFVCGFVCGCNGMLIGGYVY